MKKALFFIIVSVILVSCNEIEIKKEYYQSGIVKSESEFLGEKKNGISKNYYKNGDLEWTAEYFNGKMQGNYNEYYPSGIIKIEASFYNDKQNGMLIDYFENGKIKSKKSFKAGNIDGFSLFYFPSGKLKQYSLHENGITTFYHVYDEKGNLIDDYHEVRVISIEGDTLKEGETYKANIKVFGPIEYKKYFFRAEVENLTPKQVSFKKLKMLEHRIGIFEQKNMPIGKHTVNGYFVYNDTLAFVTSKEIIVTSK